MFGSERAAAGACACSRGHARACLSRSVHRRRVALSRYFDGRQFDQQYRWIGALAAN